MDLRPYQSRAVADVLAARAAGHRRILLTLPTGGGKSVIASHMIQAWVSRGKRILVIAHRKELLDQFWVHLRRRGITAGLMRADDERTDQSASVQLASIATLVRRDLPPADVIFVDEAHRVPGESYARTLEQYPRATVVGLTATASRLDGRPLGEFFDALVQVAKYSDLIESGSIMAPVVYAPRRSVDLSGVRRVAGDFHEGELEAAMRAPHVIGDVVKEWQEHAQGRSTVVFAVGIDHSKELVEAFTRAGIRAGHIDGTTPEDARFQALLDLETGKTLVLCNVGVLCEGWDQPRVKCCVMARPTLSLTLYMQCVGRILRPWGDQCPIVLDHAGNTERHGLPHEDREWSLDGVAKRVNPKTGRVCPGCYAYVMCSPCELCGYAPAVKPREIRKAAGKLEPVAKLADALDPMRAFYRAFYDSRVEMAIYKGYRPGWPSQKYKEKYKEWPPWAWSQETKAMYAADPQWQEDVRKQSAKREFWLAKSAEGNPKMEAAPEEIREFSGIDEL
jgi:DNA repair protein RadD